jgi:hypothetical protein
MNTTPLWEPRTSAGEALLSHNHICFLHGLYDRPRGTVSSRAELIRAAFPYLARITSPSVHCMAKAVRTLQPAWVERSRDGRKHLWTLTRRGRQIVERRVRARIRGYGPYEGFAALVRVSREGR